MKVIELSLRLTRLNPMFDSMRSGDGKGNCREIFIESRGGDKKIVARIDETKEKTYDINFTGYKKLSKNVQKELTQIIEEYCSTPVEVRLAK